MGFVIFDKNRKLQTAGFHKINPPGSILAAEIVAIMDGISLWNTISQEPIMILSDCKEAITAVSTDSPYKSHEESIIHAARKLLRNSPVTGIRYCPRNHNTEAHTLAKMATKSLRPQAWVGEDIPRHILSLAQDYQYV